MKKNSDKDMPDGISEERRLMRIRTEAIRDASMNMTAHLIRCLMDENGMSVRDFQETVQMDDKERLEAILYGAIVPTRKECRCIAEAFSGIADKIEEPVPGPSYPAPEKKQPDVWEVYTDGGYADDCHVGSWAYIIIRNGIEFGRDTGHQECNCSQEMEATAILNAMKRLELQSDSKAIIKTDCKQIVDMMQNGTDKIRRRNNPTVWQSLILEIEQVAETIGSVQFRWVSGHSGNRWNEVCDSLCSATLWEARPERSRPNNFNTRKFRKGNRKK